MCELLRDNLYEFSRYNRESGSEPYFTLPRLRRVARQCLQARAALCSASSAPASILRVLVWLSAVVWCRRSILCTRSV